MQLRRRWRGGKAREARPVPSCHQIGHGPQAGLMPSNRDGCLPGSFVRNVPALSWAGGLVVALPEIRMGQVQPLQSPYGFPRYYCQLRRQDGHAEQGTFWVASAR